MDRTNPDADRGQAPPPRRGFRVTFVVAQTGEQREVVVDPGEPLDAAAMPGAGQGRRDGGHEGPPGSLLRIALAAGVPIEHACGGVGACATCHVIVRRGLESCNPASEAEEDRLDEAAGLTRQSRLACQAVPDGTADVLVEIPAWNRNLAGETG